MGPSAGSEWREEEEEEEVEVEVEGKGAPGSLLGLSLALHNENNATQLEVSVKERILMEEWHASFISLRDVSVLLLPCKSHFIAPMNLVGRIIKEILWWILKIWRL